MIIIRMGICLYAYLSRWQRLWISIDGKLHADYELSKVVLAGIYNQLYYCSYHRGVSAPWNDIVENCYWSRADEK